MVRDERCNVAWGDIASKVVANLGVTDSAGVDMVVSAVNHDKNSLVGHFARSPCQACFGRASRVAAELIHGRIRFRHGREFLLSRAYKQNFPPSRPPSPFRRGRPATPSAEAFSGRQPIPDRHRQIYSQGRVRVWERVRATEGRRQDQVTTSSAFSAAGAVGSTGAGMSGEVGTTATTGLAGPAAPRIRLRAVDPTRGRHSRASRCRRRSSRRAASRRPQPLLQVSIVDQLGPIICQILVACTHVEVFYGYMCHSGILVEGHGNRT